MEITVDEPDQYIQKIIQKEHQYAFSKLEYAQKKYITSKMDQIEDKIVNQQVLTPKLYLLNQFKQANIDKKLKFDTHKLLSQINDKCFEQIKQGEVKILPKKTISRFPRQDVTNSSVFTGYQSGGLSSNNILSNISYSHDRGIKSCMQRDVNKKQFWSSKQIQEAPQAKEFKQLLKKMKEEKTDLEFKVRYHKELEEEKQKILELSEEEKQQKKREEKKKMLIQKFESQKMEKLKEKRLQQEKQREFQEFYSQFKDKNYLFKQKENEFTQNQISELENKKKKLQEIRNLTKPIDRQNIADHQNWYKDFKRQEDERKQQQQQQKEKQQQMESQVFKQYYKGKANFVNEQEDYEKIKQQKKQELIERRREIKVYSQAVKDNFAPQISQQAQEDLQQRIADLNRNKTQMVKKVKKRFDDDKEIVEVEYVDLTQRDTKKIGQNYLRFNQSKALKNGKTKTSTNFDEIEKQQKAEKYSKPKYQSKYTNNLQTNYEITVEQRELQNLQRDQHNNKLSSEEKNTRILYQLNKLDQKVKLKEQQVSALFPTSLPKQESTRQHVRKQNSMNNIRVNKRQSNNKQNIQNNNNQSEIHEKQNEIDDYYYTSMRAKLDILNSLN